MPTESAPPPSMPETFEAWARRKIGEHEERLDEHEELIGREASATKKTAATGMHARFDELRTELRTEIHGLANGVDKLTAAFETWRSAREAERALEEQQRAATLARREPITWQWALKIAAGAAIVGIVGGGLTLLGAVLSHHWH